MKMVKSLLLGSAAGLVAVAGAQAADLPVKAKPVQYVKICSLYGVGFYYIPGTDMCIKIGGWVRAEYGYGQNGNFAWGWANSNVNNRYDQQQRLPCPRLHHGGCPQPDRVRHRSRLHRGRPEYQNDRRRREPGNSFSANRAFIQWAGFTFGRAQSFFDFYSSAGDLVLGCVPEL